MVSLEECKLAKELREAARVTVALTPTLVQEPAGKGRRKVVAGYFHRLGFGQAYAALKAAERGFGMDAAEMRRELDAWEVNWKQLAQSGARAMMDRHGRRYAVIFSQFRVPKGDAISLATCDLTEEGQFVWVPSSWFGVRKAYRVGGGFREHARLHPNLLAYRSKKHAEYTRQRDNRHVPDQGMVSLLKQAHENRTRRQATANAMRSDTLLGMGLGAGAYRFRRSNWRRPTQAGGALLDRMFARSKAAKRAKKAGEAAWRASDADLATARGLLKELHEARTGRAAVVLPAKRAKKAGRRRKSPQRESGGGAAVDLTALLRQAHANREARRAERTAAQLEPHVPSKFTKNAMRKARQARARRQRRASLRSG